MSELGAPIMAAILATKIGRREAELVEEVVYAAAGLLDGSLDAAVRQDAGFSDARVGPADVIDLASPTGTTAAAAKLFERGVASHAAVEAELTHLYMAYLERSVVHD